MFNLMSTETELESDIVGLVADNCENFTLVPNNGASGLESGELWQSRFNPDSIS